MTKLYYYKSVSEDGSIGYLAIDINYKKLPNGYERITEQQFNHLTGRDIEQE